MAIAYGLPRRPPPLHVRASDEAFALGGDIPATSYLDIDKVLKAAKESGADAIHPGYGFLSENADFAQAVLDAGLIWIGPPPQAIRDLGDKVAARHIAQRAGAPLVAGTPDPVSGADEVVAFAEQHGLLPRRPAPSPPHAGHHRQDRRRGRPRGQGRRPHRRPGSHEMEQPLNAHKNGTIKGLTAQVGASIASGAPICDIRD